MADDTDTSTNDQQGEPTTDDADADKLGTSGQRALAEERAARRKAERDAKTIKSELEKLRTASQSEQEKALAKAREEGKTEGLSEIRLERVRDKIEAKAGGRMADPEDAAALLGDLGQFVTDDGSIDTAAIGRAIDQLLKAKPYLATNGSKRPTGGADGGARGNGKNPVDMNAWLRGDPGVRLSQ